ncbi:MAG: RDD family protein, partial [Deltaproteobacteria bacterium]|nr:RDD family protein [Deltaproteobacteria bacterium]
MSASQYGGFWKRVVAYIIDGFVLLIPTLVVSYFLMPSTEAIAENPEAAMAAMPAYYGLTLLIDLIYFAGMESSAKQATLGKMALGMKVTDVNGNRISIGRAVGRFFGKLLSGLI